MMSNDFEENIYPYAFTNNKLCISFAGEGQLTWQFRNTFRRYGRPHIAMRDSTQRYHYDGIIGIGSQVDVINYIRSFKPQFHITTVGISSGAFPALFYGQMAEVDEMIVFSALTSRNADDFPDIDRIEIDDPINSDLDLRKYFVNGPVCPVKSFISDGDGTRLDRQMSTRIGIEPIVIPGYHHATLAKGMRDSGMFDELFGT